ncbi:aldo/keto reductase [Agromyces ramosus]|uniref:Aryl-alcohol dehydrogenase-like predicted oxidoreductase n=1 Tax=Agromyces ramosus TaxID=33879 RepID=A0ABU0R6S6_9MICO|nr:aldo/keto reductase [Agromyces ramosus]MDQ0893795.1 aryl-alcohol dehydrogenase-like predicted oxidoreductase [Agromyces ramosus]
MRYRTIGDGRTSFDVSTLCLGTMFMGTRTDEATSFAILDRFVEAGGTFIDTANNYNAWVGGHGRDSEDLIGRWLASRGARDRVRIATKLGAAKKDPTLPLSTTPPTNYQGLGAETIHREAHESLRHLGVDHIDVLYGHVDDRDTPIAETVGAFGALQVDGVAGITGISNVALWRVVEAREEAMRRNIAPYGLVQQQYSYIHPEPRIGRMNFVTPELLDYAASAGGDGRPPLAVTAYSPLHQGSLSRSDKPMWGGVDHPTTHARIRLLHEVARDLGATPNQVALAWLLGAEVPVIPVIGASSLAQLEETLGAAELDLDPEVRARLDAEPIEQLAA